MRFCGRIAPGSGVGAFATGQTGAAAAGATRFGAAAARLGALVVAGLVELAGLVKECIAEQIPIADSKGVDLGFGAVNSAEVAAQSAELRILFGNLLDNAVRYTPPGGSVDVGIFQKDGRAIVEIADTGPGVKEQDLARLTERFFRASSPEIEGSGLGLAIVEAIIKRHGFELAIANRAEGGLLVQVACPLLGV